MIHNKMMLQNLYSTMLLLSCGKILGEMTSEETTSTQALLTSVKALNSTSEEDNPTFTVSTSPSNLRKQAGTTTTDKLLYGQSTNPHSTSQFEQLNDGTTSHQYLRNDISSFSPVSTETTVVTHLRNTTMASQKTANDEASLLPQMFSQEYTTEMPLSLQPTTNTSPATQSTTTVLSSTQPAITMTQSWQPTKGMLPSELPNATTVPLKPTDKPKASVQSNPSSTTLQTAKHGENVRPTKKPKPKIGWIMGLCIGLILITTIIIISVIGILKCLMKKTVTDPNWAGTSPFADGQIETRPADDEKGNRQTVIQSTLATFLPRKFSHKKPMPVDFTLQMQQITETPTKLSNEHIVIDENKVETKGGEKAAKLTLPNKVDTPSIPTLEEKELVPSVLPPPPPQPIIPIIPVAKGESAVKPVLSPSQELQICDSETGLPSPPPPPIQDAPDLSILPPPPPPPEDN
ncbi:protein EVI2B [Protopterus annectens]|uniref:protein EVI2B n=1 Tax=Protopterus annectens TaxID=7888 RepID=UPI001CF9F083|nr:protein EVI2B [Protopterus annectens]